MPIVRGPRPLSFAVCSCLAAALVAGCQAPERAAGHPAGAEPVRAPLTAGQSRLWGVAGELYDAKGRLCDWSYAGYHAGEQPIPAPAVTIAALTPPLTTPCGTCAPP